MNFSSLIQNLPKLASAAGGLALVVGVSPILGFILLTASAVLNLASAIKQKKPGDVGFFSVWAFFNSWFATHSGGH